MPLKNVVGLFDTSSDAQAALRDLKSAGFSGNDISFVANNSRGEYGDYDTTTRDGTATEAEEGAGFGATGGAVLGGLAGLLVGLGALAIPGIGPVVAAGTLATTLGSTALGAGLGAAAGGLVGALVGAGVPEEHANVYAEGVRRGGALLTVHANSDEEADRAADIMDRHNVVDIDRRGEEYRSGGFSRFDENAGTYDMSSDTSRASYTSGGDADTSIGRDDYDRSSKVGTAGGGLAGAATGAAIGSVGGPVGTVIGGVAGALSGGAVGAAGDAAGAEASDSEYDRGTTGASTMNTSGTAYGSTTDYNTTGTTSTTGYNTTGMNNTTLDQAGEIKVPIVQEELQVGKREVEGGGVRVNTRIEEVPVNEQVTLREETVDVHRRPVNRDVTDADINSFQEGTFEVVERDEQAVVAKQARVVEEVHIKKNVEERVENIQDTVRRTDVDVQQVGGTTTAGYTDNTINNNNLTGTTGTTSNEGFVEGTMGNINNTIERNTGLDTDRSGDVGDRDTRNNY